MDAMSKPGATELKALATVLAEDVSLRGHAGKDEVLNWIKSWPGKSLFRTGSWREPSVVGDQVRVTCMFDSKAAYYSGELTLSFDRDGRIAKPSLVVLPAPEPLGGVINRVWGPRRSLDQLTDHLGDSYGITVRSTTPLDNGVLKVETKDAGRLVARVFPADRPVAEVEGDAAILGFLEKQGFPAERCAGPVSVLDGQGLLLTHFVEGKQPAATSGNAAAMAGLLGRLHTLKGGPKAARRDSGGLHLYSADTTVRSELDTAVRSLEAGAFRGTDKKYDALRVALLEADDFAGLPAALSHPDFHFKNMVATTKAIVPIDWAGVGKAPASCPWRCCSSMAASRRPDGIPSASTRCWPRMESTSTSLTTSSTTSRQRCTIACSFTRPTPGASPWPNAANRRPESGRRRSPPARRSPPTPATASTRADNSLARMRSTPWRAAIQLPRKTAHPMRLSSRRMSAPLPSLILM